MVKKITYPLKKKEEKNWAVYYDNDGYTIQDEKIMGRQAAGWSYLKALVHSKPSKLGVYLKNKKQKEYFINDVQPLLSPDQDLPVEYIPYNKPFLSQIFGGIFIPGPGINQFSEERSIYGPASYSLVGITHTTASHRVMTGLKNIIGSHIMPWDAIICTSSSVLDTVNIVLEKEMEFLSRRLNIKDFILPKLPIIPLGIDSSEFNYSNDFKSTSKKDLNISDEDITIAFVGRLSFHAKAHHYPMYLALENISKATGKKINLIQTGWFGNDFIKSVFISEVKSLCPSINCILDGTDQNNKHKSLAVSDIFISLSDNIQETFGITPLEGMAAGLPVVVTDWNGYKDTVRDKKDGYRIKTISMTSPGGHDLAYNHMIGALTYDLYIGLASQRVAVDISDLIEKLTHLVENKDKRVQMGIEAKKRAKSDFDWKVILNKYNELSDELDRIRVNDKNIHEINLPSDRLDPFLLFRSYPSEVINDDLLIVKNKLLYNIPLKECLELKSVNFGESTIPTINDLNLIYNIFDSKNIIRVFDIKKLIDLDDDNLDKCLLFLLKYGYLSVSEEKND